MSNVIPFIRREEEDPGEEEPLGHIVFRIDDDICLTADDLEFTFSGDIEDLEYADQFLKNLSRTVGHLLAQALDAQAQKQLSPARPAPENENSPPALSTGEADIDR